MRGLFQLNKRYGWIRRLEDIEFDIVVIGGGITGAGIALDAVTRDLKVLIIDMDDFASGTSSRSSKIVHGGLRYLTNYEFSYISEISRERGVVYENAPHVISPVQMILPIYKHSTYGTLMTKLGLKIYDFLANVRAEERNQSVSRGDLAKIVPKLRKEGLNHSISYVEYCTEDARLTLEVIKEAVKNGAIALNYMRSEEILSANGEVNGIRVKDILTDKTFLVKSKSVVNAAGPWVKEVSGKLFSISQEIFWLKGAHFVFSRKRFPLEKGVFFEGLDKRMMAAIPKDDSVYVGTTDNFISSNKFQLYADYQDSNYILQALNYAFPGLELGETDIISSWAGVRTALSNNKKDVLNFLSKDEIHVGPEGLVTVVGGTLTGYRKTGEKVVDILLQNKKLGIETQQAHSLTHTQTLSGGYLHGVMNFQEFEKIQVHHAVNQGWNRDAAKYLIKKYGGNFEKILTYRTEYEQLRKKVKLPEEVFYSLVYGILDEMVIKPIDFFARRTDWLYFQPKKVERYNEKVCLVLQYFHNWTNPQLDYYIEETSEILCSSTTFIKKES